MDSYAELRYMETSCQLLQIREEISSLTKQKEAIERKIKEKQYEEADLCKINLRFIKIVQKTKGSDNYSPEKWGVKPGTPSKGKCASGDLPCTSSSNLPDTLGQPVNLIGVKKSLLNEISAAIQPAPSQIEVGSTTDKTQQQNTQKNPVVLGQFASTSASQSTEVRCSGKSNVAEVLKTPHVMSTDVGLKNTAAPETSGLKSTPDAGSLKNTLVPEGNGLKNIVDEGSAMENTSDDELDDDMLLLAGKSMESSLEFGKTISIFQKQHNKPRTALEDWAREIAIANPQPSTSALHTQPPSVPRDSGIQGLKLFNAQGDEHVVCHNVSPETSYLPSYDTNTALNNDESSHDPNHVGFAQESVPIPQQEVPQPSASGPLPSSPNEMSIKSFDDPPNMNNECTNQNKDIQVHGKPNVGAMDCPPDALAFEDALSHVSEMNTDEAELLPDDTNT